MVASVFPRNRKFSGGVLRRFLIFTSFAILFIVVLFSSFLSVALAQTSNNPGDMYVFPGESPVYPTGNSQYEPAISGNIVLWDDSEAHRSRIFFKDLSKGPGEPGHALIDGEISGGSPEISKDGNMVVWTEMIGANLQLYYKNVNFTPDYTGCIGNLQQCGAVALYGGQYWQENPAVSQDGSKIAWEYGRSHGSQIYLKDLSTGTTQEVYSMPNGDQEYPSVDNDWVVWTDNRSFNSFSFPLNSAIYVKQISGSEPARAIVTNNGNPDTSGYPYQVGNANTRVSEAKVGRNQNNEPIVTYISSSTDRYGVTTNVVHLYNLVSNTDQSISQQQGRLNSPNIDGDKLVWLDCSGNTRCDVVLYDLTTHVQQKVSQDPSLGAKSPAFSASSNYIVWRTPYASTATVYYNRADDTAQQIANKFAPELHFRHDAFHDPHDMDSSYSDFEPRPIGIMLNDLDEAKFVYKDGANEVEISKPAVKDLIDHLGSVQDLIDNPDNVNYLDLPGSPTNPFDSSYYDDYHRQITGAHASDYPVMSYARVLNPAPDKSDKTVIQYWMLYYYNNWSNNHEGDWEMIEVVLDNKLDPECVAYSQHGISQLKYWNEDGLERSGDHPKAYVAEGSHANIFDGGIIGQHMVRTTNDVNSNWSWFDLTGDRSILIPSLDLAWINEGWVNYAGLWGQRKSSWWWLRGAESGPPGPQFQPLFQNMSPWSDPYGWAVPSSNCDTTNADGNDIAVTACSPVEIGIYDQQGNLVVGKNISGGINKIPGAEYFERSSNHSKNIIIHGADSLNNYRLEVTGTGSGNADLKIHVPSSAANQTVKNQYLSVPVTASMRGSIDLIASPAVTFHIDDNGDGVFDQEKQPDASETRDADFTPPGQISDLNVTEVVPQAVILQWTATGDDLQTGTAFKYEIRYCSSAIADSNWNDCKPVAGLEAPQAAGQSETTGVQGLSEGNTYFFAVKAWDDGGNVSPISNVISAYIPIRPTTAGAANATPASLASINVTASFTGDENTNGAAIIQYKLSADASWNEYGIVPHPANYAVIQGLDQNASYDVYVTYQDPDGVNGSANQLISGVQLPAPPAATHVLPTGVTFGDSAIVSADLSAGYGVSPNSVSVTLDGISLSSCSTSSTAVSCPVSSLTYGNHSIGGSFADNAGNTASISGEFSVGDNASPTVTSVQPSDTVYGGATTITAQFSDPGISSGINTGSVSISLDGNALQGCTATESSISCDANGVLYGAHTINGSVADNDGNSSPIMGSFYMIEWSTPSIMYQSTAAISQPSLYRLSDGRTMVAYTDNLSINAINFKVSSDNGLSWQIPTGSSGHVPCAAGVQPSITQLPSGIVVIAYAEYYRNPLNGSYSWVLRVTQSSDLINWSWPSFAGSGNSLAPSTKTLSNGQVLLAHTKNVGNSADLYATKGTFNGSYWIWGTDSLVYGGAQYDSKPALADAGNGDLLVAFFSGSNWSADRNTWLSRDINLVRSTDNGLTWSQTPTAVYANTGSADFWPTLIRLNNGSILCAFTTSDQGSVNQLNIKMVRSNDGGVTWGSEQMISVDGHSETWPALVQQADGSILAVWDSDPGQASGVYYLYSSKLPIP